MKRILLTLFGIFSTCLNAANITAEKINNDIYVLKIIGQIAEDDG